MTTTPSGIGEISRRLTDGLREKTTVGRPTPEACIDCLTEATDSGWSVRTQMRLENSTMLSELLRLIPVVGRKPQANIQVELTVHAAGQNIIRYGSAQGDHEGDWSIKMLEEAALAEAILTLRRKR